MRAAAAELPAGPALGRLLKTARRAQPLLRALASIALAFVLTAMLVHLVWRTIRRVVADIVSGRWMAASDPAVTDV